MTITPPVASAFAGTDFERGVEAARLESLHSHVQALRMATAQTQREAKQKQVRRIRRHTQRPAFHSV